MPLTGIGQSVHLSTGANQNQKIVAVEGDVRLHRSQDQDEKSINGEATEHCSTNGDAESVSQEESFPVKAVLSTTAGLSISLHPQLVKEYDQKFSAVFYELKKNGQSY